MGEQGDSEVIIGETHFKPETPSELEPKPQDPAPETSGKSGVAALIDRVRHGLTKGYEYMDAGITPKEVPVEEITDQRIAKAIKDFRLEVGRFNKYDPEFASKPFTVADLLRQLGYHGNWEIGKTNWNEKHKEAYTATRRGIDELVRQKAINVEEAQGDPDNESIQYRIADENAIINTSEPPTPQNSQG